eukprot:4299079-Pyramimonas_sp.AAC.1
MEREERREYTRGALAGGGGVTAARQRRQRRQQPAPCPHRLRALRACTEGANSGMETVDSGTERVDSGTESCLLYTSPSPRDRSLS